MNKCADLNHQLQWFFLQASLQQSQLFSPSSWMCGWVWSRYLPEGRGRRTHHFNGRSNSGTSDGRTDLKLRQKRPIRIQQLQLFLAQCFEESLQDVISESCFQNLSFGLDTEWTGGLNMKQLKQRAQRTPHSLVLFPLAASRQHPINVSCLRQIQYISSASMTKASHTTKENTQRHKHSNVLPQKGPFMSIK